MVTGTINMTVALAVENDHWLAQRAAESDIVVLAQLDRINYRYRDHFPVGGNVWLRPLRSWKTDLQGNELLAVHEQGLHDSACYFPQPLPWEERPRYLLFLVQSDDDETVWRGHPKGCALEVLVTDSHRYAVRWPQAGFGAGHGRDDAALQSLARAMTFQGPNSRIDASDLPAHQRRERAESDFMQIDGTHLIPTRGIELADLRRLMHSGLQTEDTEPDRQRLEQLRCRMIPDSGEDG